MSYIEKEPIIEFITKGLNNPDKTKAFGYDAIEILTEIEYAPTADVVPKSEVAFELVGLYNKCASKIPHHIRRIFKDDKNFEDGFREGKTDALIEVLALIAELKKKYTEGESNGSKQ